MRNQLIINHSFEQVVLIADSADGARFMAERGSMSKNVKMCFTFFNGDKRRGRLISYTGSGGINHSPIDEWRGQLRMQIDKEDQIRYAYRDRFHVFADESKDRKKSDLSMPRVRRRKPRRSTRDFLKKLVHVKHAKRSTRVARNSSSTHFKRLKNAWRVLRLNYMMPLQMRPLSRCLRTS